MSAQKKSVVRRAIVGGSLALVAGVSSLATMSGSAFAAETPDTTASTSATSTATPGQRGPGRDGVSTAVVEAADGTFSTQVRAGGSVTEVSATSISIKSTDGTVTVFAVPATVDVSAIAVGDTVNVRGTQVAGLNTAADVHSKGTKPSGAKPSGEMGERPTILHEVSKNATESRIHQNGEVTAISDTSVTVKSADGFTATYTLESGVTTTAKVGDEVGVMGSGTDGKYTAKHVMTATEMAALPARGPRGEEPATDAAPATSGTAATVTATQNGANVPQVSSLVS